MSQFKDTGGQSCFRLKLKLKLEKPVNAQYEMVRATVAAKQY